MLIGQNASLKVKVLMYVSYEPVYIAVSIDYTCLSICASLHYGTIFFGVSKASFIWTILVYLDAHC